jgi:uncharacterized protein with PQ loop repeat
MPGLHHYHLRKRIAEKRPVSRFGRVLDHVIYAVGVIGPLMTVPQILEIWVRHNAAGVSPITWGSFVFTNCFWLSYGIVHRERPIIMTYCLWIVVNGLVVTGTLLYR